VSHEGDLLRMLEPAVRPAGSAPPASARRPAAAAEGSSFQQVLDGLGDKQIRADALPLKISAHAQKRLGEQGVELSERQMRALSEAAALAEAKGAGETLMLMGRLGLIVNIPNRTVVTALTEGRLQSGVITQIDSTVLVQDSAETDPDPVRLEL